MAKKPFLSNDTTKEERTYEPFLGAKLNFIKQLEEEDKKEIETQKEKWTRERENIGQE